MDKKRMAILLFAVALILSVLIFLPEEHQIAWGVLGLVVASLCFLWNTIVSRRYRTPTPGKRKQSAVHPRLQSKQRRFEVKTLIELAALVSDNDPDIMKEVSEAAFHFQEYTAFYRSEEWLSNAMSNEKFWERWYPNNKTDPVFMSEYIDDKPIFCCLNMLEWLADKDYVAYIDAKWPCDEIAYSVKKLAYKKKILLDAGAIKGLSHETLARGKCIVYTHENVLILSEHLISMCYRLIDLGRDGDCYDLVIVSESAYDKITYLDLEGLGGILTVQSIHK